MSDQHPRPVTGRVIDLVNEASDEIVLIVLDDDLLDEGVLEALGDASDRDVTVHLGAVYPATA